MSGLRLRRPPADVALMNDVLLFNCPNCGQRLSLAAPGPAECPLCRTAIEVEVHHDEPQPMFPSGDFRSLSSTELAELRNCLAVLGLPADTRLRDVKRRFRQLALVHHPDLAGSGPGDRRRMAAFIEAYQRLLAILESLPRIEPVTN